MSKSGNPWKGRSHTAVDVAVAGYLGRCATNVDCKRRKLCGFKMHLVSSWLSGRGDLFHKPSDGLPWKCLKFVGLKAYLVPSWLSGWWNLCHTPSNGLPRKMPDTPILPDSPFSPLIPESSQDLNVRRTVLSPGTKLPDSTSNTD